MDEEAGRTDSIAGAPTGSTVRCGCGQARIQQLSPGQLHLHGFESFFSATTKKPLSVRIAVFRGGGGRIRTIEAKRSRFTVCPLWPLGNSPIFNFCFLIGAGRRTRTPDLLITNQLLYRLSYTGGSNRTCLL